MMVALILFLLGTGCLGANFLLRWISDRWARGEHQPPGQPFNTAPVQLRLEAVRQDYFAEVRAHPRGTTYHNELILAACRSVARMAFFRSRREHETTPGQSSL